MRVLNFGSMNIDTVFSVSHAASAGESLSVPDPEIHAGGKGLNQSIAAARAGAEVFHAGRVGSDGAFLLDLLRCDGIDVSCVVPDSSLRSGGAIIQVEPEGRNTMLIYGGANRRLDEGQIGSTLNRFGSGDILMLQNETNLTQTILCRAAEKGMYTIYNPSPITPEIFTMPYERVDLLIVNEDEAAALAGGSFAPQETLLRLHQLCPNTIVFTLGQRGSCAFFRDEMYFQEIFPVNAVDTTGAGDTFAGYIAAALARGEDLPAALRTASAASAIAVTKHGAAVSIPTLSEVEAFLKSRNAQATSRHVPRAGS